MGQKTHPVGFRLGITKKSQSRWFSRANYATWIHEDIVIRDHLTKKLNNVGLSKVGIERSGTNLRINIHTARPGLVIGKKGTGIDALREELGRLLSREVTINILEVRKPELDAKLVGENIALQLERRVAFRRAMKKSVASAMKFGALGVKIQCAGRLAGSEIARTEWYREGRVPLHTLRADVDYGFTEAKTTYGLIGVKVWIYTGDIYGDAAKQEEGAA
jgi:small subunit ribosomal protein S3